ncbi:hypothetical protein TNCV_1124841 [Trichonephila clavipes]|uniref:Uncharacterized protein n=1 Tax=Trichonephila clavipes TaxID=2585209 RepID=A0A8X6SGD6_TRICX|nr:hypothetical protein TNCV_1124841 [Trichonephila clavipes]
MWGWCHLSDVVRTKPSNPSWQGARSTLVVGLEHHKGDSTNKLEFKHGAEGEGNILQSPALVNQPTELTSTYFVCTRRVFGSIGHRTQVFRSGVRFSNH